LTEAIYFSYTFIIHYQSILEKGGVIMPGLIVWKTQHINRLKRDMDRIFDTIWGEFTPALRPRIMEKTPFIDLTETKSSLILRAEIPGVEPNDIEIDITDNILTIKGEARRETIEEEENSHRMERSYGSFSRSIQLPCRVIIDDIKAVFKNGILKITMPKCAPETARKIKIEIK
jgi:HSP20 family protein